MSHNTTRIGAALMTGIAAGMFVYTGFTLAKATFIPEREEEAPAPIAFVEPHANDTPARLRIPLIGVDARVQHVGIAKSGKMAVPDNFTDAGWYRYGTVPGERGSAVMDGHVDNAIALPGVFKRLSELTVGDSIEVQTTGGDILTFGVTSVESFDYRDVPLDRVFNQKDKARLNLITCDGAWIQGEKTYDRRLVVFAELR